MGTEMIENFTRAARAQMDALLADAKGYEVKRAACLADAERLRMALVSLGQTAPAVPTNGRPRAAVATQPRKRKRMQNRAPDGVARAAVLTYAASVEAFTIHDMPSGVRGGSVHNALTNGHIAAVGRKRVKGTGQQANIYQITDKGRAWLAAYESKGAK